MDMTTVHGQLKARFEMVRQDLDAVLDQISDQDLDWAPGQGMRTVRGQLIEITGKEVETLGWIRTCIWPDG